MGKTPDPLLIFICELGCVTLYFTQNFLSFLFILYALLKLVLYFTKKGIKLIKEKQGNFQSAQQCSSVQLINKYSKQKVHWGEISEPGIDEGHFYCYCFCFDLLYWLSIVFALSPSFTPQKGSEKKLVSFVFLEIYPFHTIQFQQ